MDDLTTIDAQALGGSRSQGKPVVSLIIAWYHDEPHRAGEVALMHSTRGPFLLGRGGAKPEDEGARVEFVRQRPGGQADGGPLASRGLSRQQLRFIWQDGRLRVERIGRCALFVNGTATDAALVHPGDTVLVRGQLLLLVSTRCARIPRLQVFPTSAVRAFGGPDVHGLVGESPVMWVLRDKVAFAARRNAHVLVLGETGAGKELVAQSLHLLSSRARQRMVSRNAATLPAGLIDAELFGNIKDYPNPGMAERAGIVGEAADSTLFLDEIGEMPSELQAHLLRVLDNRGEYQRLGDPRVRYADLRLVGATNRPVEELKHDLVPRFSLHVTMPGLNERREDIPLLIRHLLKVTAAGDPEIGDLFFENWNGRDGEPRIALELVDQLVRHDYTRHVRELKHILMQAMAASHEGFLASGPEVARLLSPVSKPKVAATALSREDIVAALDRCEGNRGKAWRELGLSSRHAFYRLLRKYDLLDHPKPT